VSAFTERRLTGSGDLLVTPDDELECAVLVLAGSSGRVDTARARLLASRGAGALAMRWFGNAGQPPGICEVPIEQFTTALDRLSALHPRVGVVGVSTGAEAALLLAARDPRITFVAAFAPTHVVWANLGAGTDGRERPYRSSFSVGGRGLPFVPYDNSWKPASDSGPPAWRGLYEQSLVTYADLVEAATIPVEDITAAVLLVAGGEDQVWPSTVAAEHIAARRARHALATEVVVNEAAGHRTLLPGEPDVTVGATMARGGDRGADRQLGADAWPLLLRGLGLATG
jgi:alpha-beta hydrolase superfamily lysophospholipase